MSIVFPSDTDLTMRTAQIQVDITDPEGILGVLRSLQSELKDLLEKGNAILELNESRAECINKCTKLSDQISEQLTDLLSHAETMETMIHEDSMSLLSSNRDIDQLQSVQDRLESMNGEEILEVSDSDLDNEQRLIGFVADELSSKIEELSKFRQRLTDANDAYSYEWEQSRNELRQYNTGWSSLETAADHLHELHLARFAGEITGTEDSELLFRLVDQHMNQITHRKLKRELSESQIKQQDLLDEIGTLMSQKRSVWKQCLHLEQRLEDDEETPEDNTLLRPTAAFSNLLDVIDGKFHPSMTHDLEQVEEEEKHGLYLHKCTTDINIKPDFSDDEESDTATDKDSKDIYQTPETSKGSYHQHAKPYDNMGAAGSLPPIVNKYVLGHLEESPMAVPKLRMRKGVKGRTAMSMRIKSSNKMTTTGSIKNYMFKKRRASHV